MLSEFGFSLFLVRHTAISNLRNQVLVNHCLQRPIERGERFLMGLNLQLQKLSQEFGHLPHALLIEVGDLALDGVR